MAPIRRYLRITKYSVLEVRIFLQKPSDVSWLLSSRDPALPRIIHEVRPKVLPKLREENENAKRKTSKKKRGVKDVASQDDFEVAIFLKETSTRHSLLTKRKDVRDKPRMKSTGNRLTGWVNNGNNPIEVEDDDAPQILQEPEEDDVMRLHDLPEAGGAGSKRKTSNDEEANDGLFVSSSDEEAVAKQAPPRSKRRRQNRGAPIVIPDGDGNEDEVEEELTATDDKKKLAVHTSYEGFSIYGRILCLIVTRKQPKEGNSENSHLDKAAPVGGSQMMEQWVSTQVAQEQDILDDEEG